MEKKKLTEDEKRELETYRVLDWTVLLAWLVMGVCFAYFFGYMIGEHIIPFVLNIDSTSIKRMFAILLLFALVQIVWKIYLKIED